MTGILRVKKIDELEVIRRIAGSDALVLCHRNPDADTVGSAIAICEMIRLTGGKARPVCETKFLRRLHFLCGSETGEYKPGDEEGKLVVAVDVASPAQLGELAALAEKTALMIVTTLSESRLPII